MTLTTLGRGFTTKLPPVARKHRDTIFGIWEDYIEREDVSLDTADWSWLYPNAYSSSKREYDAFPSQLLGEDDEPSESLKEPRSNPG